LQKFTAVFDNQFVGAVQGKVEALGPESLQLLVFLPGQVDVGERSAAKRSALSATGCVI